MGFKISPEQPSAKGAMVTMTFKSRVYQIVTPQHRFKHEFSHLLQPTKYQRYGRVESCNKLCLTPDYVQSYYPGRGAHASSH